MNQSGILSHKPWPVYLCTPMVIAVNARFLQKDKLEGYGYFVREVFLRMAAQNPQHQFFFLFDRPWESTLVEGPNIHAVLVPPAARHPILWKYWFDIKIPLTLKKIRADVFVSPDGYCSLTTRVPQCVVIHDLGFLHYPKGYKRSHLLFYKRFTPRFLRKAKCIATVSEFSKRDIVQHYKISPAKINVVYSAAKEVFKPASGDEKAAIKIKYTEGKEFFIYVGSIHPRKNLIHLLKAFSIFKRRQRSNMKLVLAGRMAWKNAAIQEQLNTYKYRDDVVLTGYLNEAELAPLLAAAYALVYPSLFEGFGVPVLEAMQSKVPALTSKDSPMQEIAGDAALYFDPLSFEDMGEKLMLIYKDETLRQKLIEKGVQAASNYTWDRTASLMWSAIKKTASG